VDAIDWLLDSDPAISWQAMRNLTDASPAALGAERARVPREGIGAEILASQGPDGYEIPLHPSGRRRSRGVFEPKPPHCWRVRRRQVSLSFSMKLRII
jgi:hypothetical protein